MLLKRPTVFHGIIVMFFIESATYSYSYMALHIKLSYRFPLKISTKI